MPQFDIESIPKLTTIPKYNFSEMQKCLRQRLFNVPGFEPSLLYLMQKKLSIYFVYLFVYFISRVIFQLSVCSVWIETRQNGLACP